MYDGETRSDGCSEWYQIIVVTTNNNNVSISILVFVRVVKYHVLSVKMVALIQS